MIPDFLIHQANNEVQKSLMSKLPPKPEEPKELFGIRYLKLQIVEMKEEELKDFLKKYPYLFPLVLQVKPEWW